MKTLDQLEACLEGIFDSIQAKGMDQLAGHVQSAKRLAAQAAVDDLESAPGMRRVLEIVCLIDRRLAKAFEVQSLPSVLPDLEKAVAIVAAESALQGSHDAQANALLDGRAIAEKLNLRDPKQLEALRKKLQRFREKYALRLNGEWATRDRCGPRESIFVYRYGSVVDFLDLENVRRNVR